MESLLKPKNINLLCRICLAPSKTLTDLSTPIGETVADFQTSESIHTMLEKVTFTKIILEDKIFPSKICKICLSFLKISYEFQRLFEKSQSRLGQTLRKAPIKKAAFDDLGVCAPSAPVELIIGDNKFDLNNVVIIEPEEQEKFSYEGFLSNLGSEVSARFVNNQTNTKIARDAELLEDIHTVETPKREQTVCVNNFNHIDVSELTVTNCPNEDKIVIKNDARNVIIRTLYQCKHCKKILRSRRNYEDHIRISHSVNSQIYICDQCGHVTKTKSGFRHHMERHSVKGDHRCYVCGKRYTSSSHLRAHLSIHQNLRNFLCNVCGKNFNYATSLKYHLLTHAEKKLGCNVCGAKFTMPQALKRHLRIHTKEKPYRCDYCDKKFCSLGEKKSHELTHTGEKPVKCKYCEKRFTKVSNMKSHCMQHSGPHQCCICLRGFVDSVTLRLHARKAHREFGLVQMMED